MNQAIIITLYYENPLTLQLCRRLCDLGAEHIIVINDGGRVSFEFENELISMGCHYIKRKKNHGKGNCLRLGFRYARSKLFGITGFITADADGQHRAEDVVKVAHAMDLRADCLIIGRRNMKHSKAPLHLKIFNKIASVYFKIVTGVKCRDPLSGLRGLPISLYPLLMETKGDRFDYEMNYLTVCADRKVPFYDVGIVARYFENQKSNYHIVTDTYLIFITPLKFATASLGCALIDLILFTVISYLLPAQFFLSVAAATILARITSGGINFFINRRLIFKNDGAKSGQMKRYLILFACIMLASMTAVSLLSFLPVPVTALKIPVDLALWTVNYSMQRKWVFREQKPTDEKHNGGNNETGR